jgi:membrane-associated phospholipid phosphatase
MAFGLLLVAVFFTYASSYIIGAYFPNRPVADDIFFKLTPHLPSFSYLADLFVVIAIGALIFIAYKKPAYIAPIIISLSLIWIIRAFLNVLTPLADPSGDTEVYGFLETTPLFGMFPSGHTATIFAAYFWSNFVKNRNLGKLLLLIGGLEILSLLVTRGHYSIDIVGGIVLAFAVVRYTTKRLLGKVV